MMYDPEDEEPTHEEQLEATAWLIREVWPEQQDEDEEEENGHR